MAFNTEPYATGALHAAHVVELPGEPSRVESVQRVVDALVTAVTGTCHETNRPPLDSTKCECIPCRAWRAEKSERAFDSVFKSAGQLRSEVDQLTVVRDTLKRDLATATQTITEVTRTVRELESKLGDQVDAMSAIQWKLNRAQDEVEATNKHIQAEQAVNVALRAEVERLAALVTFTQDFVSGFSNR